MRSTVSKRDTDTCGTKRLLHNAQKEGRRLANNLSEKFPGVSREPLSEIDLDISRDSDLANEKLVMIVSKNSGLAPYSHEFGKSNLDPQIISGFISAMASFMGVMMGEPQTHWKTEYGSESMLLVEHGTWAIGVLLVSRETTECRSRLRRVVREFEDCFVVLRDSDGIEGSALRDFDQYVRRAFVNDQITGRTLVIKGPEWKRMLSAFGLPSTAFGVSRILLGFEETQTVKEIAEFQNLAIEEVIDLVSEAYWHNAVFLKYIPPDDEILVLSEKSSTILFRNDNPLRLSNVSLNVTARFDGRTSLSQLAEETDARDLEILLDELGTLVNRGFIQRISSEQRHVLLDESTLSSLVLEGARIFGNKRMKQIFEAIRRRWGHRHPRIYRVTLTDRMRARCIFDENMNPDDLDDLTKVLELFIEELGGHLSTTRGKSVIEKLHLNRRGH